MKLLLCRVLGHRWTLSQTGECVLCASYGKDYDATERLNQLAVEREREAEERGRRERDAEVKALRAQRDDAVALLSEANGALAASLAVLMRTLSRLY